MSLLEALFGPPEEVEPDPDRPRAIKAKEGKRTVCAIVSGELIAGKNLPDPLFASGAMGLAIGIKPKDGAIFSPVTGTVAFATKTLHALGIRSDDGLQVLIHLGVDTVDLRGDAFTGFVNAGQHIRAGEPLVLCDLDKIAQAGYSDVAIIVLLNVNEFASVSTVTAGSVCAGEPIMVARK